MFGNYNQSLNKEYEIPENFLDSCQSLRFSPSNNSSYLLSGGWDCLIRLFNIGYQVNNRGSDNEYCQFNSNLNYTYKFNNPILCVDWIMQQGQLLSANSDGTVNMIDPQKNQINTLGKHDSACKEVLFLEKLNIILSGGWDGALNIWDPRQNSINSSNNKPILACNYPNKIYTIGNNDDLLD